MDKLEVARRQLGTALQLYLDDKDSVSVQCLAAGGGEIAEHLAAKHRQRNFFPIAMETSTLSLAEMRTARNVYWNAFKHFTDCGGQDRDDERLLASFDDDSNELMLFVGWFDYMNAAESLPIEVQVFQIWVWAKRPDRLGKGHDSELYGDLFPAIGSMSRAEQKAALRSRIAWARGQAEVMQDVKTDPRPLDLGPV
ncbi:MAG: hypothetical protein Q8L54_15865 [Devosia sp.]|nr:hypothetical protein [Devosia sp.]